MIWQLPSTTNWLMASIHKTIDHYITYSVISSAPALTYSSVISTIRCFPVTSGKEEGATFVQWSAHFSSDADAGMCLGPILSILDTTTLTILRCY